MKKLMALLTVLVCFTSINSFAQEVRGIETRRVVYEGKQYKVGSSYGSPDYATKYYGWELTNLNSCTVSVDITMFEIAREQTERYTDKIITIPAKVIATKSIVLNSRETYIFKYEFDGTEAVLNRYGAEKHDINNYYIEYKAFKLQ